jgi:hypothetical protein
MTEDIQRARVTGARVSRRAQARLGFVEEDAPLKGFDVVCDIQEAQIDPCERRPVFLDRQSESLRIERHRYVPGAEVVEPA